VVACGGGGDSRRDAPQSWCQRDEGEGRKARLIVKANYCKKGAGERGRAKATLRYITHRRDREGHKVTRDLFGFDGGLSKDTAYRMIDAAPEKRRYYYRIIISPDPRREDSYRDLSLQDLTIETMLKLEERYGKPIQFIAALHDDHSPHRHAHTLVILNGRRLTRADFAALRDYGRHRALKQRRFLDRRRRRELLATRSRSYRPPFGDGGNTGVRRGAGRQETPQYHTRGFSARREAVKGGFSAPPLQLSGYTCPLCGRYQALPYSRTGYRCLLDGVYLRREQERGYSRMLRKRSGMERERAL
jgi:hypothetical protein